MRIGTSIVVLLLVIIGLIYFLTGYRSAFEADQYCHYEMQLKNSEETIYGCDHDIETRQWILFQEGINNQPALVVKRFRY